MENEHKELLKLVAVLGMLSPLIYIMVKFIKDEIKKDEEYTKALMCFDEQEQEAQIKKLKEKYKQDDKKYSIYDFICDLSGAWLIGSIVFSWFCVYLITVYKLV